MKITELRVGNIIGRKDIGNGEDRIETIIELGEKAITSGPIKIICEYDQINPIPLTEEWLLIFGFKKTRGHVKQLNPTREYDWVKMELAVDNFHIEYDYHSPSTHKGYNQGHEIIKLVGDGGYDDNGEMELSHIKYVHQLQNLFYTLTGEELPLKVDDDLIGSKIGKMSNGSGSEKLNHFWDHLLKENQLKSDEFNRGGIKPNDV